MNRKNILKSLTTARKQNETIRVNFKYDESYYYFLPFAVNDDFFYAAEETDFILNGYNIRRIKDIDFTSEREDICNEILKSEGLLENIEYPKVDISSWKSIFTDLKNIGKNIIIEDEYEGFFYIGRIEEVEDNNIIFKYFDADGVWQEQLEIINYNEITSVTFNSRYVEVFSNYLKK